MENKKLFNVGDIVQLKSGGPLMVAYKIEEDEELITCEYFTKNDEHKTGNFNAESLISIQI